MSAYRVFSGALAIGSIFLSCHSAQRVSKSNLSYIYQDDKTVVHPEFKVYHRSESESDLYIRVKSGEMLYSRNNPKKVFSGKLVMQLNIYQANHSKSVFSDTVYLFDETGPSESKYLVAKVSLKLPEGENYFAEMTIDDIHRMQFVQNVLLIDKTNALSQENFLITNEKGEVQFGNAFDPGTKLLVQCSGEIGGEIKVSEMEPFDKLPAPPFMTVDALKPEFTPRKENTIAATDKNRFEIELGEAGIYYISDINGDSTGLTFHVFHSYYPYVKSVASMISPLRYITTKQEFEQLQKSTNLKKDIDDFWLKLAGNAERATEIIEEYYSRVEQANKHFTSYTQGWRTDRGLVLIIYGRPTLISKNGNMENWLYSDKANSASVEFIFNRSDNAFKGHDYILERAQGYKSSWYRSIDGWRQGRIYN